MMMYEYDWTKLRKNIFSQNIWVAAFQFHVKRKSISNLTSGLILVKTKRPPAETKVTPNMKKKLVIAVFEVEVG